MMKKIMRKILPSSMIAALLVFVMCLSAFAELVPAKNNWLVTFTSGKKMSSNFRSSQMDDAIYGLQPGDYTDIVLNLKNDNENTTDWYMTNKVLKSLEDTRSQDTGLSGGAYTYILTYQGTKAGSEEKILFSSDIVGGQNVSKKGEGLHEATDALKDWFYLDTLKEGEGGTVKLRVALEGETQGNDYQDTLAELQMNFAVEMLKSEEEDNDSKKKNNTSTSHTTIVKTGDYMESVPYLIASGVSGLVILFLAVYSVRERRRQRGGKA